MENYTVKLDVLTMLKREILVRKLKDKAEKNKKQLLHYVDFPTSTNAKKPTDSVSGYFLQAMKGHSHGVATDPQSYYLHQFHELNRSNRKVRRVKCPFHNDKRKSLRIDFIVGGFDCCECLASGWDFFDFHRLRYQLSLVDTITFFKELHDN